MSVISLGTFDILHTGHINLINTCYKYSPKVIIGLNSDEFVKKYRGKSPIMSYQEREEVIKLVFPDILIVSNDQPDGTIRKLLTDWKPTAVIIGSDWMEKDYIKQIGVNPLDMGIHLIYVPYTQNISSTEIKRRVCSQLES